MADPAIVAGLLLARCETLSVGTPVLPVAMPEMSFTPPTDNKYLRVDFFANKPAWEGLGPETMDQGLLQVVVVWPWRRGIVAPRRIARDVMSHFPKGLDLTGSGVKVTINKAPWAASPILEEPVSMTPVTISWVAS